MGCGGSKNAVVPSVGSSEAWSTKTKPSRPNSTLVRVKSGGATPPVTALKPNRAVSRESLRGGGTVRGVSSATSKASANTCDSGLESDYGNVITEESDPALATQATGGRRPNTPDLTLQGTQIEVRKPKSGKGQRTGKDIISELKDQGLLCRPAVASQSGLAFEVMIAPEFGILKKPPARLTKLKKRRTKKRALTKEELEAKLRTAEERRRRNEAQNLEKLDSSSAKEKQVHGSLDSSEEAQQRKEAATRTAIDLERVTENREARIQALREKQERRRAHAEKVRLARLARQAEGAPTQDTPDATLEAPESEQGLHGMKL